MLRPPSRYLTYMIVIAMGVNLGCTAKVVILPKDASYYYTRWQESLKDGGQCEEDLVTLKDSCDKLIPFVRTR